MKKLKCLRSILKILCYVIPTQNKPKSWNSKHQISQLDWNKRIHGRFNTKNKKTSQVYIVLATARIKIVFVSSSFTGLLILGQSFPSPPSSTSLKSQSSSTCISGVPLHSTNLTLFLSPIVISLDISVIDFALSLYWEYFFPTSLTSLTPASSTKNGRSLVSSLSCLSPLKAGITKQFCGCKSVL